MKKASLGDQIKSLRMELLRTQRQLACCNMAHIFNDFQEQLSLNELDTDFSLTDRMENELELEVNKLKTSLDPLKIAITFNRKCHNELEKLGLKSKELPSVDN